MSKIEESLGACPWCGDPLYVEVFSRGTFVGCRNDDCGVCGPLRDSPQAAAAAWLDRFPRLGLPVDPPEGFVRVRVVVWTDHADAIDAALEHNTCAPADSIARASTIVADVPLQTVYEIPGVVL